MNIVNHPRLAPQFTWDAEKISKFNGLNWEHVYHEPWTANDWWSVQSTLPDGASPLCFILYADKTKLSSFGAEKGYPIVARIANLPVHIRNSNGFGGGQVVGWLPIVEATPSEAGKTDFVNHKNAVWHASFELFLEEVIQYTKTGISHTCGDSIRRLLYPILLILSADYEEQCIMTLIRGLRGLRPCPKCLIPKEALSDLSQDHELRTAAKTSQLLEEVANMSVGNREEKLKAQGLRPVKNVFHLMRYSDVNLAAAFDRLHTDHSGMWGDHIGPQVKLHVRDLGREACQMVDDILDSVPRWRDLNHFTSMMQVTFTDGSKHEDMLKASLAILATHSVLTEQASPLGYLLLRTLRRFNLVDMYAALEEYIERAGTDTKFGAKDWDFIKAHLPKHVFDDIMGKGVTRNYNTKPNEKLHGPLKNAYRDQTNFKDVAPQILAVEHCSAVARLIREDMEALDQFAGIASQSDDTPDDVEDFKKFSMGSIQPPCTLDALCHEHRDDTAFGGFRTRVLGQTLSLRGIDQLQEYRYLKVNYESRVDWRIAQDYLRCNPQFHNRPRYDFVIYQQADELVFAQLILIFKLDLSSDQGSQIFTLALVQPYDMKIPARDRPAKDRELGLLRRRSQPRKNSVFIEVNSIIRGALLVKDPDIFGDKFVVDTVDTDMFLRLHHLHRMS
ncbi:hypothetical protein FIBSPDRAFT_904596 [Athelia psychrophila]|uniref:Uncharacterized protein n=1 Tax=Athelia psychrophila TaxID=1759441 RepID=A0A167UJH7_9AGAM|nr:hypothetical protein FIBSPDRAFT_904596 [Fibularhizoctonia sp. CBS 109695]